jgi:zinc protease
LGIGIWFLGFLLSASLASAQFAPYWPQEAPPRPLPAREFSFPPYEVRALPNGMRVVTVLHHEQPAVTMRLLVGAGAAQDPEKKSGTAQLVGSLLDQGTTTRSAPQIAAQIDSIGGLMSTGAGTDLSSAYVAVMKDSFALGMDLLHDVVRNPAFAPEEIERQKEQAISSLQVSSNDPDYVASVLFDRLVYGFHPYGLPGSGTPESLMGITRADLQAFHKQYFVPNNMILAIVGDVTSEEAFATAERVFGAWPRGTLPAAKPLDPPPPTRRVVVVDKPDSVQTEIRVGQLAIPRKHDDYLAWDLTVKILGGEGANRLHRVLRSERGLTYGASAETQASKQAGDFVAETDTRTETTGEVLRLTLDEFSRLQRQRVIERELADAQAYLAGSFPLTVETPNEIATLILNSVHFELPLEEVSTFTQRVKAITPDDIQRVARQYIKPDRLSVVLVGNAQAFVPQLRALGITDFEVIPIQQLDLMSATLRREPVKASREPVAPLGAFTRIGGSSGVRPAAYTETQVNPSEASLRTASLAPVWALPRCAGQPSCPIDNLTQVQASEAVKTASAGRAQGRGVASTPAEADRGDDGAARDLLAAVVKAKGGLAALKGVRTVVAEAETTFQLDQGAVPSTTKTYVVYPDRFRVDATLGKDSVVQVYNAGAAWQQDPGGVREAPPPMRSEFAASVQRDTFPMLIAAAEGRLIVRSRPAEKTRDGRPVRAIEISGVELKPVTLFIDDKMLIAGQSFASVGPNGQPITTEEVFSDYRVVDGIQVPFEARLLQNGRPILTRTLKSVAFNSPVDDSLFARPR